MIAELEDHAAHMMAAVGQEPPQETAGCRALMGFWLRALAGVAIMLADRIVAAQLQAPGCPLSEPHGTAWVLLLRARRWMRVLHRLLRAGVATRRLDRLDRIAGANPASQRRPAQPDDGPAPERTALGLMNHVCACLNEAAWLLGEPEAARYVNQIGISATAMLTGGATEELRAWAEPMAAAVFDTAAEPRTAPRLLAIAAPDAPDTG